jgi:hypothetical protein
MRELPVLNEGCQERPAVRVNALRPKFDEIEKLRKPAMSASDAVDGSSTGIAMCQIAVDIQER